MRWRRGHGERPPRVGAAVLLRALAGVLTVFIAVTAGVAGAGYLQIPVPRPPDPPIPGFGHGDVVPPEPDGPRTLLVLGSDRRAASAVDARGGVPHSDTIVLLRLDPDRNRIAVLSLPRDLAVHIPGLAGERKINEAYDHGGPAKTLKTVKALFGDNLEINGVIDVNFRGFQEAVNALGGIYVDVDRDYSNPEGTGYASIDVKAGYQRLVGSDALAYVRYRHDDSDLFRNARQQEFLRQASAQPAVDRLKSFGAATEFADELVRYFRFDESFGTRRSSAGMIKTALSLARPGDEPRRRGGHPEPLRRRGLVQLGARDAGVQDDRRDRHAPRDERHEEGRRERPPRARHLGAAGVGGVHVLELPEGDRSSAQELRSARQGDAEDLPRGAGRARRQRPAARGRDGAGAHRADRRVLHRAQALSERRLLFRHHAPRARLPEQHADGALRGGAHRRLGGAVERDGGGRDAADRPPAPALHRRDVRGTFA